MARAILRQVYNFPVYLERPLPSNGGTSGRTMKAQEEKETGESVQKIKQMGKINGAGEIDSGLRIYPNPASNGFTILYSDGGQGEITLSISNSLGNVLHKNVLCRGKATDFNTENLNSGMYIVRINSGTSILAQQKLVIMK